MSSAFLSHSSSDKPWVRRLAERLTQDGVVVWLDEAELQVGDSLIEKIADGIERMKYVIAIISPNSISSSWVQKELSLAMTQEVEGRRVKVLPLLIGDCEVPEPLRDKLYADFREPSDFESKYASVLKALGVTPSKPAAAEAGSAGAPPSPSGHASSVVEEEAEPPTVRIVGVDKDRTVRDDQYHGLYHVHLELAPAPPHQWDEFFAQERAFPRHSMWRDASVEGSYIIIKCALDELEKWHLRDLKRNVEDTNRKYAEAVHRAQREQEAERREQQAEQQQKEDYLDRLDFD